MEREPRAVSDEKCDTAITLKMVSTSLKYKCTRGKKNGKGLVEWDCTSPLCGLMPVLGIVSCYTAIRSIILKSWWHGLVPNEYIVIMHGFPRESRSATGPTIRQTNQDIRAGMTVPIHQFSVVISQIRK